MSVVLGFIATTAVLAPSNSSWAQIAIKGRYWQYDGERVLLLGGWNHGHNPFIDHDTDNDRDNQGVSSLEQIIDAMDELAAAGGNCLRCVLDPGMAAGIQKMGFCARTGELYDLTGSYTAAFLNGLVWNVLNLSIAIWLLTGRRGRSRTAAV